MEYSFHITVKELFYGFGGQELLGWESSGVLTIHRHWKISLLIMFGGCVWMLIGTRTDRQSLPDGKTNLVYCLVLDLTTFLLALMRTVIFS